MRRLSLMSHRGAMRYMRRVMSHVSHRLTEEHETYITAYITAHTLLPLTRVEIGVMCGDYICTYVEMYICMCKYITYIAIHMCMTTHM